MSDHKTSDCEFHPIQVFLHEADYLRNYVKARKAERRGDPVEAANGTASRANAWAPPPS